MAYDPKMTCYPYPEITDKHYLVVKKNDHTVFDKNYPYVDKSAGYKFKHGLMRIVVRLLAFPIMLIATGLKVSGRENLKKHREVIKNGVVSVVNHVHMWDFICIMWAVRPNAPWIPVWDKNMRGENKNLIRYNNGIPIPTDDIRASAAFSQTIAKLLDENQWVHVSAEGSMWEYYQPIRPFKKGAFRFAVKSGKPVLPLAFSFREPKGIQKLFHKKPLLNLKIGEPIFPDTTLPDSAAIENITKEAHSAVCVLAGIDPKENIYEAVFNDSHKVNYY